MAILDEQNIYGAKDSLTGPKGIAFNKSFPTQNNRPKPNSFINEYSDGARYSLTDEEAAIAKVIRSRGKDTVKASEIGQRTELASLLGRIPENVSPQNLRKVSPDAFREKTNKAGVDR
jgi:hypothetical protein